MLYTCILLWFISLFPYCISYHLHSYLVSLLFLCAYLVLLVLLNVYRRLRTVPSPHLPRMIYCLFCQMGNCLQQWRVTVGMFYCRCQKMRLLRKVSILISFQFPFISFFYRSLNILLNTTIKMNKQFLNDIFYFLTLNILLITTLTHGKRIMLYHCLRKGIRLKFLIIHLFHFRVQLVK